MLSATGEHHEELRVLRQTLSTREAQLEAKAGEQARLEDVVQQLMVRTRVFRCSLRGSKELGIERHAG